MIEVYIIRINKEQGLAFQSSLLERVSESKRRKARRYRNVIDAHRTLMGEVLARFAICKHLKVSNSVLSFDKNKYGKPLLTHPLGYDFNWSHSGEWVVCAISDSQVGIDVEEIKPVDLKIAESFFSSVETKTLFNKRKDQQLECFYRLWTLKESYIKAVGKGLSIPLDSFSFHIGDDEIYMESKEDKPEYYFKQFFVDSEHMLSLCSFKKGTPRIHQLNYEELGGVLTLLDKVND